MPKFNVCGRTCIYTARGTQTIRISVDPYQRGVYDWVVRFTGKDKAAVDAELPNADTSSLEAYVKWLRDNLILGGEIERVPPDQDALLVTRFPGPAGPLPPFTTTAINAVESAINDMLCEFLKHPYRHRSENNVHCEVYGQLKATGELAALSSLGSGERVQSIHREWPNEFAVNRTGGFRLNEIWPLGVAAQGATPSMGRGKYDLVVLSPDAIAACGAVAEYADGKISPLLAVEFGLNESYEHLRDDVAKLNSNKIPHGYVVHLLRPDARPDNFKATERLLELVAANNPVRAAYARVEMESGTTRYHYKFVGDTTVTSATSLPGQCGAT